MERGDGSLLGFVFKKYDDRTRDRGKKKIKVFKVFPSTSLSPPFSLFFSVDKNGGRSRKVAVGSLKKKRKKRKSYNPRSFRY